MSAAASAPPAFAPGRYRRNIRVYYLFMASTGFMLFLPVWIIYLLDGRGLSLTEVGIIESFFWLTVIIAEVPTGAIADRFGRRISLALGAIMFAISTVIFAIADGFSLLLGSYLVMGIGMTLYSGAGDALLYDTLRVLGRTREYEHHAGRSHGLFFAAMVLATAVGGPAAYFLGYTPTILVSAAVFICSAGAAVLLREPPRRESDFPPDPLHGAPAGLRHTASDIAQHESGGVPILQEMTRGFGIVWRNRPHSLPDPLCRDHHDPVRLPHFLAQPYVAQHGLNPLDGVTDGIIWSSLLIPGQIGTVFGMLVAARLIGKLGERRSFPAILVYGAVCLVPLAIWNHLGLLGAIFMVSIAQAAIRADHQRVHQPTHQLRSTRHRALNLLPGPRRRDEYRRGCHLPRRRPDLVPCGLRHRVPRCDYAGRRPLAALASRPSARPDRTHPPMVDLGGQTAGPSTDPARRARTDAMASVRLCTAMCRTWTEQQANRFPGSVGLTALSVSPPASPPSDARSHVSP